MKRFEKHVARINDYEPELRLESDEELRERVERLRGRAVDGEPPGELLLESFAVTREASRRTLGERHFDVQLIGGMVLCEGSIAEIKPGEGKALTSTLAICFNALSSHNPDGSPAKGRGVHLVTVNDYLARRGALWMKPIYDLLGVTVGILQAGDRNLEDKKAAYAADVTYGTASEFGFGYLRDNLATDVAEKSQRGHGYAIIDDVDSVLIDEARTPLIISGQPERAAAEVYYRFAKLAPMLEPGKKPEALEAKSKAFLADLDLDEKHKTVAVTARGVEKAERFLGVDNLYRAENGFLVSHLQQALKAEWLYKRGVDYEVIDGEVKIIDEFTGRILEGRRWSEGLHQAIEAKEGVAIQEENQTVATITYQNYFRRYDMLAGMTGTAVTEATEFMKVYRLAVVEIPTNRPVVRRDLGDEIYRTKQGKWAAVLREIAYRREQGQPVLVGTISLEVSALLSEELRKRGIEHAVLNAKPEHAERAFEIIAEAGRPGAVTIATIMAGRRVDIELGGNAEHLTDVALRGAGHEPGSAEYGKAWDEAFASFQEQVERDRDLVVDAGGLFVLGTDRHESRRIDHQLRGRSGRRGDPGESRFYLSAQDELVRLFAGPRIYRILEKLGPVGEGGEDEPIEAKILARQFDYAQKRVEEQNLLIRMRVLDYDDAINQQRETVYGYRDRILTGEEMSGSAREQMANLIERIASEYMEAEIAEEWDLDGLLTQLARLYPCSYTLEDIDMSTVNREAVTQELRADLLQAYDKRENELGDERMRALERFILLQSIDKRWRKHLHDMDYLRERIHLRGFAQIDPLVAFTHEVSGMFTGLMDNVWQDAVRYIFNVDLSAGGA